MTVTAKNHTVQVTFLHRLIYRDPCWLLKDAKTQFFLGSHHSLYILFSAFRRRLFTAEETAHQRMCTTFRISPTATDCSLSWHLHRPNWDLGAEDLGSSSVNHLTRLQRQQPSPYSFCPTIPIWLSHPPPKKNHGCVSTYVNTLY